MTLVTLCAHVKPYWKVHMQVIIMYSLVELEISFGFQLFRALYQCTLINVLLVLEKTNKIILCIIIIKTSMYVMYCLLHIQVLYYTNFPCNWYNHMIFEDTFKIYEWHILCASAILSENRNELKPCTANSCCLYDLLCHGWM